MGVDVVDLAGRPPRLVEGRPHRAFGAAPVGGRGRGVVGVGAGPGAGEQGAGPAAPGAGRLRPLQDEHGGALADHEPVPVGGERP